MSNKFLQLEMDAMNRIINESAEYNELLKKQYESAIVINRTFTGVGFYTEFRVDESLRINGDINIELGNINATIQGLKFGVGFILFIRKGLIKFLEGYTYDENLPNEILNYKIE